MAGIEPAQRVTITDIQPGDIEAVAGREVEIAATITQLRSDESATCSRDCHLVAKRWNFRDEAWTAVEQ